MTPGTTAPPFSQHCDWSQRVEQLRSSRCWRLSNNCGLFVSMVSYAATSAALYALAATSNTHTQSAPPKVRAYNDTAMASHHTFLDKPINSLLMQILTWSFASLLFLGSIVVYLGISKLGARPTSTRTNNNPCKRCLNFMLLHLIPQGIAVYKSSMVAISLSLLIPDYCLAHNNIAYYTLAGCSFMPLFAMTLLPRMVEAAHADANHIDRITKLILCCYSKISPWIPALIASVGLSCLILKTILNALNSFLPHIAFKIINIAFFPSLCIILPWYYTGLQFKLHQQLNRYQQSKPVGRLFCKPFSLCTKKMMASRWRTLLILITTAFYSEGLLLAFYTFFQPLVPPFVLWSAMLLSLISVFWTLYRLFDVADASEPTAAPTPTPTAAISPDETDEENPGDTSTTKLETNKGVSANPEATGDGPAAHPSLAA